MPLDIHKIMVSPRAKVKWANRHIDKIVAHSSPLSRDLYEIRVDPGFSVAFLAKPDCLDLRFVPKEPIPEFFALIVGDAVHNLRTALDHWAVALVGEVTGVERDKNVSFPIEGKQKDLEAARGYKAIEKALPDAAVFIRDTIKPYREGDGDTDLWSITEFDNIDKHNFILPTVTAVSVEGINARIGTNFYSNMSIGGDAAGPVKMILANAPITIENNFKTSVEITFPKGSLFEDQPVIPVLTNLSQTVAQTLNRLEEFLRSVS